jgi:hypothetical protein
MQPYANTSGSSPIDAYQIDPEGRWIAIRFRARGRRRARTYRYTAASTPALITLIDLALIGSGLASFIARERPDHAEWS